MVNVKGARINRCFICFQYTSRYQGRGVLRRRETWRFRSVEQRPRRVRPIRIGVRPTVRSVGVGVFQRSDSTVKVSILQKSRHLLSWSVAQQ